MTVTDAAPNVKKALLHLRGPVRIGGVVKTVAAKEGRAECYASLVQLAADLDLFVEGEAPVNGEE